MFIWTFCDNFDVVFLFLFFSFSFSFLFFFFSGASLALKYSLLYSDECGGAILAAGSPICISHSKKLTSEKPLSVENDQVLVERICEASVCLSPHSRLSSAKRFLVAHPKNDHIVPFAEGEAVYEMLQAAGAQVEWVPLENCTHFNVFDKDSPFLQRVIKWITKRIDEITPRSSSSSSSSS